MLTAEQRDVLAETMPPGTQRDEELAREVLFEGRLSLLRYTTVETNGDLWSCGPQDDRTWKWALHAFIPLDPMIRAGFTADALLLIEQWCAEWYVESESEEFPWHDHATALRLDRISHVALRAPEAPLFELAAKHAVKLLEEAFYSKNTNHGFDQALSLLLAGAVFSDDGRTQEWIKCGLERLQHEIAFAFTSEGVHKENSPGYHGGMITNLERARVVLSCINEEVAVDLEDLYEKALTFLAWMSRPDRFLVYLGDTVMRRPSAPQSVQSVSSYQNVQWAVTNGEDGTPPPSNSKVWPESGYAVYRSTWDPWPGHLHLVMKCGAQSQYHMHDDDLHVLLHAYGQDWLIDSGMYSHNQRDPVRIYMRSSLAHNVPYFKNLEVSRGLAQRQRSTISMTESEKGETVFEATTHMYKGAKVQRQVIIKGNETFQLRDRINSVADSIERYWLFHTTADKRIRHSPSVARIQAKGRELVIRVANRLHLEVHTYRGQNETFSSMESRKPNEVKDGQVIVFGPTTVSDARFVFTFGTY